MAPAFTRFNGLITPDAGPVPAVAVPRLCAPPSVSIAPHIVASSMQSDASVPIGPHAPPLPAATTRVQRNKNMAKLQAGYLFPEVSGDAILGRI